VRQIRVWEISTDSVKRWPLPITLSLLPKILG
jgi:hypothetical protein